MGNAERTREAIDAFNRRDGPGWMALCAPEIVNVAPQEWPESEPIVGPSAIWDFYMESFDPWENSPMEHRELIEVGNDKIAAEVYGELHGKASGAGVPWHFWQVVTFRDELVVRIEWFADRAEALEAAGLAPPGF
jgi:ketosteroid isomerase-like protein